MTLITCPRCSRQVAGGKFCPGCGARLDDPLAGKVLAGKWKLVTQTARGAFFSTYRAEPKTGGVPVSVKVLEPAIAEVDDRRRRFLENAGAALSLTDRRLLAVREMAEEPLDREDGKARRAVYAVVDAPGGPSLSDIVAKQGAMDPGRAVAAIRGLLEALAAVHGAGLVHGDLHPACVFLEPDGAGREQVRLADAGLAQGLGPAAGNGTDPSASGSDGGRWLSPEQAQGNAPAAASDVHAAGALLYFALTGTPPWQAEKGQALLFEIQRSFPRAATEVRLEIPEAMDGLIDRALAKAPGERWRSAAEFARALGQASAGLEAAAPPAVPDDITPGAMTLGGIPAAEPAMTAVRRAPEPEDATMTAAPSRAPGGGAGDDTFVGTAAPAAPPAARPARPAPAPTAAIPRTPAAKAPPPAAAKPAARAAAPPAKPPARRAPPPPPPADDGDETLTAAPPPLPAKAAPPAPPARVRGAWSVGTPVAVFAILGFLGVGSLYGFVWAGYFDWKIPPWVRTLAGRDATGEIPDDVPGKIPPLAPVAMTLNVEFTLPEIRRPMDAEAKPPIFGTWRIVKDPAEAAAPAGEPGKERTEPKIFASGDLSGTPSDSGVIPVLVRLPPGRYQLEGSVWCGTIVRRDSERNVIPYFEVGPGKTVVSYIIETRPTTLTVNILPKVKALVVLENTSVGSNRKLQKEIARGEKDNGTALFGLPSDLGKGRLLLGETWLVKVTADGKKPKEVPVSLLSEPTVLDISLEEDPKGKVGLCVSAINDTGVMPPEFENDPAVKGHPDVMVAMAQQCAKNGDWPSVEAYVRALLGVEPKNLPASAAKLYADVHAHLRALGQEAAGKGDVVRVREVRGQARPDVLGSGAAEAERKAWAEIEAAAWLAFPQGGAAVDAELDPVERMVVRDMPLLPEAVRKQVALRILEHRAWPAWRAGNELRPGTPPIPGPPVKPWIDLAQKAFDLKADPALLLSWRRLAARLEDLESRPESVVKLLVGDDAWTPAKGITGKDVDALTKKDRLLLARALARWGILREPASAAEGAKLCEHSLSVYQTCFEPDAGGDDPEKAYPEPLAAAARAEAIRMAQKTREHGTVEKLLDQYLAVRPGDEWARELKALLLKPAPIAVPTLLKAEELVEIPGGLFQVGGTKGGAYDEQPFKDPATPPLPVNYTTPVQRTRLYPFLVTIREVNMGQYRKYLEAMKDPDLARKYAHPAEPKEKSLPGARAPERVDAWADSDPARADWWDAFACARYLGGRLPMEAEWEMAARWCGRETPFPDPMPAFRAYFPVEFVKLWPSTMRDLGAFDASPSGVKGMWGGVAEWTLDPFKPLAAVPKDGIVDAVTLWPPTLPTDMVMCVRGASNYHLPPGEPPGESPLEKAEKLNEPAPAPGVAPPAERTRTWRAMDILERRGVPVGTRAKWLGFRIVVDVPASRVTSR